MWNSMGSAWGCSLQKNKKEALFCKLKLLCINFCCVAESIDNVAQKQ